MPLTQTIGLEQLSEYFHMPINEVAKDLGVCATVLKKICRRNGIPRWPHRKIKSLDKMIKTLETTTAKKPEDEERIKQEIATLRNKKMFLMKNPNVLMKGSKSGSKYKATTKSTVQLPTNTTSTTSTSSQTNIPEKVEWNSTEFGTGSLQQEEAAKSLLNVFASLQNKLQDQPKEVSPVSTDCSAWYLNPATEPQLTPVTSPTAEQKALFSLELPKLMLAEEHLAAGKKLMTMEPTVGGTAASMFPATPHFGVSNNVPRQELSALPSWFLREKEQYDASQVFATSSPLSLNSLCHPSPRSNAVTLSSLLAHNPNTQHQQRHQ
eukprot:TRINITY_DN1917_c0_g1_i1.p1 TRINITY_DN1917_c0_g1~~TRINITY_DN1917_c0_g1_i1.p1  ORF type:complete len:322 (+),score=71.18 TRINITY_DN1917_c0_g1_i1:214-1179(+)